MWQNSQKPNNNGNVTKNDVARPDRTARSSWSSSTSPRWGQTAFSSSPYQGRPATSFRAAQRPPAHMKEGLTNSVGPQPASVRLWTPLAAPSFARGYPWTPRACRSPAGSPALPPSRSSAIATKGCAPGPLGGARPWPGPRLRRPAIPLPPT